MFVGTIYYRMPLLVNLATRHPMTMQAEPISWQPLRADEVEQLPSRLKSTLGDTIEAGNEWVVLRVHGGEIGGVWAVEVRRGAAGSGGS